MLSLNDPGDAAPGVFTDYPNIGYADGGNDDIFTINADGSVTQTQGWGGQFTPLVGDKWRPNNYRTANSGALLNKADGSGVFFDNNDYTIATINGATKTMTFAGITSATSVVGVGGFFNLTVSGNNTNCPTTSTANNGKASSGDVHLAYSVGALGLAGIFGAPGAATAWGAPVGVHSGPYTRFINLNATGFNGIAQWAYQPTP
jgi:hypothetical protein